MYIQLEFEQLLGKLVFCDSHIFIKYGKRKTSRIPEVIYIIGGFPGSLAGKESACIAGDPGLIPGSRSSPGEGTDYPLQYSWASLVVQMVKNQPAMWETWVRSLGWEDPLEEGMATNSSVLAWRIPMDRGAWQAAVHDVAKSWTQLSTQAEINN